MGLLYVPHIRGLRKCFSCRVRLIALSFASSRTIRVAAPVRMSFLFTFKPNRSHRTTLPQVAHPSSVDGRSGRCFPLAIVSVRMWFASDSGGRTARSGVAGPQAGSGCDLRDAPADPPREQQPFPFPHRRSGFSTSSPTLVILCLFFYFYFLFFIITMTRVQGASHTFGLSAPAA